MKIMTEEPPKLRVRDKISKGRFYVDNELVDKEYLDFLGCGGRVYFVLARHAHNKTQMCFPSYETLMRESGIKNRNSISKVLKKLERLNMIRVKTVSMRKSNNYYMMDKSCWKLPSSITFDTTRDVSKQGTGQYQKSSPSSIKSGTGIELMKSTKEMNDLEWEKIKETKKQIGDKWGINRGEK